MRATIRVEWACQPGAYHRIVSAVLRDNPGALEAPTALQQIVRRCLADPDRRFPTMPTSGRPCNT